MNKPYIICVDDQVEVLNVIEKALLPFTGFYAMEFCESAFEALELIENIDNQGKYIALIISDQRMPEQSGVDFLAKIHQDVRFLFTKKILLTGQATHQDTISAINLAKIDAYIEKPWQTDSLVATVKRLTTHFLFDKGLYETSYQAIADSEILLKRLR